MHTTEGTNKYQNLSFFVLIKAPTQNEPKLIAITHVIAQMTNSYLYKEAITPQNKPKKIVIRNRTK